MKAQHLITGSQAEERVVEYLQNKCESFRLIARNVRYKHGEIDIIYEHTTRRGECELVFIEVKASGESVDLAFWNFSPHKQMKFKRAVQTFLASYRGLASSLRLSLALVSGHKVQILDWMI